MTLGKGQGQWGQFLNWFLKWCVFPLRKELWSWYSESYRTLVLLLLFLSLGLIPLVWRSRCQIKHRDYLWKRSHLSSVHILWIWFVLPSVRKILSFKDRQVENPISHSTPIPGSFWFVDPIEPFSVFMFALDDQFLAGLSDGITRSIPYWDAIYIKEINIFNV